MMGPAVLLECELAQSRESGHDVAGIEDLVGGALRGGSPEEIEAARLALEASSIRSDWPYEEPSTLDGILGSIEAGNGYPLGDLNAVALENRLLGAWVGRCAGCNLGKPVEGWSRARIKKYLDLTGSYPIDDYIPVVEGLPQDEQLNWCWPETTRGNIRFMARDDDIDYTIMGLRILENHGFEFGPMDVAFEWLDCLPYNQVYTAERVAYHNLVIGLEAPETASTRNPYREWIGAQIRGDMWGYVNPGDAMGALRMAYNDACLSHTQNGIYGEIWASVLIALSLVARDMRAAIEASLAYLPPRSRLHEAIRETLELRHAGLDWEAARDRIEESYGHYSSVHVINNSTLVAAALLWGDDDFSQTIGLAVQGGWDTDCTAATSGSVFGAMHGASALPSHWIDPLNDTVRSAITGYDHSSLADLAKRTFRLATARQGPALTSE